VWALVGNHTGHQSSETRYDVVEKNPEWTLKRLAKEGFSEKVIAGVEAMTRRPGENYEEFVIRAGADPIGRTVKLADLRDNIYMSKVAGLDEAHTEKYRRAIELLKRPSTVQGFRIAQTDGPVVSPSVGACIEVQA